VPKNFASDEERKAYNAEKSRRWYERNREKVRTAKRAYYATKQGKVQKQKEDAAFAASGGRARYEQKRAAAPVSEARKAARARWALANKDYFTAAKAFRRGLDKRLDADDFWIMKEAVHLARLRQMLVGGQWHVDHIVPVSKGGDSRPDNLQVVPAAWNRRKSNAHAERFFGA
jgi:hypothetical protein